MVFFNSIGIVQIICAPGEVRTKTLKNKPSQLVGAL